MVCNIFSYVKKTSSRSGVPLEREKEHGEKAMKKKKLHSRVLGSIPQECHSFLGVVIRHIAFGLEGWKRMLSSMTAIR